MYKKCDVKNPIVESVAQLTAFQNGVITGSDATFEANSEVIGQKGAILTLAFRPVT